MKGSIRSNVRFKEKTLYRSCPIRQKSLEGHAVPDGKRGDLAGQAGMEIFHGVLPGAVHQDEAFEFKRGEIPSKLAEYSSRSSENTPLLLARIRHPGHLRVEDGRLEANRAVSPAD